MAPRTLETVPPGVSRSGAICTAATRMLAFSAIPSSVTLRHGAPWSRESSQRPGVQYERVVLTVQENEVEHIERVDRTNARGKRPLAVAVKRLQRKTTGINLATLT